MDVDRPRKYFFTLKAVQHCENSKNQNHKHQDDTYVIADIMAGLLLQREGSVVSSAGVM